jgi:hypothetical protein
MFYFRLNRVKIFDNGSGKFIGVFGSDKSKIQFVSLVSDKVSLPDLGDVINENNAEKRKTLLKEAALTVASSVIFTPIHNVKDKFEVTFGDTGIIIHQSDKIPDSFSWEFLCVKLNKDNRDLGKELHDVVSDAKFDDFAASFPKLIGSAVSAPYTAGVEIGKFIFKAFTNHLANKKDKQLGILETSFIRQLDYANGNREGRDVKDETENLRIDYSILGFSD